MTTDGFAAVPLGEHHPILRWAYYNRAGELVRELTADEVPPGLLLVSGEPTYFLMRDPADPEFGQYLCFSAPSRVSLDEPPAETA